MLHSCNMNDRFQFNPNESGKKIYLLDIYLVHKLGHICYLDLELKLLFIIDHSSIFF